MKNNGLGYRTENQLGVEANKFKNLVKTSLERWRNEHIVLFNFREKYDTRFSYALADNLHAIETISQSALTS